jgi:PPIC-type PPIASE domain
MTDAPPGSRVRAVLREPLFQFTMLGGALFLAWPLIQDKVAPPQNRIVITAQQIERATDYFYQTHLRLPDPDELQPLIEEQIQTEVEFREGLALGLDRDDEIIRRRIKQKLEFMTEDVIDQAKPGDAALQAYLDARREAFGAGPKIVFSQIYLDPSRHGDHLAADAGRLLARLNAGDGRLDYGVDSDTLPVPNDFEMTTLPDVTAMFGTEFAAALPNQPVGKWVGPIRSGYGLHLVLVREIKPGKPPELADVRDQVLREYQADRRAEANQEAYRKMRAKYVITVQVAPPQSPNHYKPANTMTVGMADDGTTR